MKGLLPLLVTLLFAGHAFSQNYNMNGTAITDCDGSFFDNGGNSANYSNNQNIATTICSNGAGGTHIRLNFSGIDLAPGDLLCFYDGTDLMAPQLACSDDFAAGSPFLVQATAANPSGCLTLSFNSDATGNATGWSSVISCIASCQTVLAELVTTNPMVAPTDTGWIDLCPGERLFLTGKGVYPQNNFAYNQSDFSTKFEWSFGDGDIAYGPSVSHKFEDPGGYYVQLNLTDTLGCKSINLVNQRVRVAPRPTFALGNVQDNSICARDTIRLSAAVVPNSQTNVIVTPGSQSFGVGGVRSDSLALPDGTGVAYKTSLYFTSFSPSQVLTDINDLVSICVNMEHSWMRDIEISLTCPNGTNVVLHDFGGQTGSQVFLGEPNDDDGINPVPGLGYDYCWTPNATNGTWLEYANDVLGGDGELPSGDYSSFEPLSDLIGCPLNGNWTISVEDLWPVDNGYIFQWGLNFKDYLYPNIETFSPEFVSWNWQNHPSIFYQTPDSISAAPQNAGTANYTFKVDDSFGCTWDTSVNFSILPFTHPDCYKCNTNFEKLRDTAVCLGQQVPINVVSLAPTSQNIAFESYPDYPFGNGNHPHQNPYSSSIAINSVGYGTITDASTQIEKVCIDIETDYDSDLNIFLRSPDNKQLELSTGNGGSGDNYKITCFTSTAAASVLGSMAPFNGNYRPEGMWNGLNGAQTMGDWKLVVSDGFGPTKLGKIKWWSISFKSPITTTYTWQNTPTLSCLNCPNPTANPTATTNYLVNTTDNFNCTHKDTVKVEVFTAFPAPTNLGVGFMQNNQIRFIWDAVPGATAYEVNVNNMGWMPANGTLAHIVSGLSVGDNVDFKVRPVTLSASCQPQTAAMMATYSACLLTATLGSTVPAKCNNTATGAVYINVMGGVLPLNYYLDNGTTPVVNGGGGITNIAAGDHFVIVRDAAMCSDTVYFNITEPPPIVINATAANATCNGENDGSASVSVTSGGVAPYTYQWQNCTGGTVLTGATANNLYAGCYNVTVSQSAANNGCSNTAMVTITEPPPFVFSSTQDSVGCFGGSDGSATISVVSGGVGPYTYQWSNGSSSATATGLSSGFQSVLVTDANLCERTTLVQVLQPSVLSVNADPAQTMGVSCFGGNNGRATVLVVGGTAPYSYAWENGQTSATVTMLSGGDIYNVTVTDKNGCTDVTGVAVPEPPEFTLQATNIVNETCDNACNGSLSITKTGGVGAVSYTWNVPSIPLGTQNPSNLCSGTYTVIATDANSCTASATAVISAANPILVTFDATAPACANSANGAIDVNISGGLAPYNFLWNNNSTQQNLANLSCGTYTLRVTDTNGCSKSVPYTLVCPPLLELGTLVASPVKCFGDANGSIAATATGGTGILSYSWNDPNNQLNPTATNLFAGTYTLVVTDANGCQASKTQTVGTPSVLLANITPTDIVCFGENTGTAAANIVGGTMPYTYLWNNGSTTQQISNLAAGTYTMTVTDANGCTYGQANVQINQPGSPVMLTVAQTEISCFNADQSRALAEAVGGSGAPYQFTWTGNLTGANQNALAPGLYNVTATDQQGCTDTASVVITEYSTITVNVATTQPSCFGSNDGSAAINNVNGGSGGGNPNAYTYNWNIPNPPNATFVSNLSAATYTVTVTDTEGCTSVAEFEIGQPVPMDIQTQIRDVTCFGLQNGEAQVSNVVNPNPIVSYNWSNLDGDNTITDVPAGPYSVTLTDDKGCTGVGMVVIKQPAVLEITDFNTEQLVCTGQSNGVASPIVTGGTPTYVYRWENNQSTAQIDSLAAGFYVVTVTDINGCTDVDSVEIFQPSPLEITLETSAADCYGLENGRIKTRVNGGAQPYTYSMDNVNFSGTSTFFGLASKGYLIYVRDANGCVNSAETYVSQPFPLVVDLGTDVTVTLGDSTTLLPQVDGGVGLLNYEWQSGYLENINCLDTAACSDILVKPTITNTYYLKVTDENGCIGEDNVQIKVEKYRGVYVPTAFTPNEDSNNDLLMVFGKSKMIKEILVFRVFDRWGELVYEDKNFAPNDNTRGWDGKFRGNYCDPGVFVWYVEAVYIDGFKQIERGNSTLIK